MQLTLAQNRWFSEEPTQIDIPDSWQTHVAEMKGDALPPLSYEELLERIRHPYHSPTLKELAKERKSAIILFENTSRGADTQSMAKAVLQELEAGGMPKDNIVFMCACATHAPLDYQGLVAKLGTEILEQYEVYNHVPWENTVDIGVTSRGFHVNVNKEVLNYDLKIGLGGILPHPTAGFGGGSKILLPGVMGIDTIVENHKAVLGAAIAGVRSFSDNFGDMRNKDIREDTEEAANMAGLDFIVNTIYGTDTKTRAVVAGHPIVAYYEGVKLGRSIYAMDHFDPVDVCICNANAKANEAGFGKSAGLDAIKDGGDVVLINHAPAGIVNHYLCNYWGRNVRGRIAAPMQSLAPKVRKLIIYNPYEALVYRRYYGPDDRTFWCKTWDEVMECLSDRGPGTTAAVIKDATVQFYADEEKFDYEPVNLNKILAGEPLGYTKT